MNYHARCAEGHSAVDGESGSLHDMDMLIFSAGINFGLLCTAQVEDGSLQVLLDELAHVEEVILTSESLARRIGNHGESIHFIDTLLTNAMKHDSSCHTTNRESMQHDMSALCSKIGDGRGTESLHSLNNMVLRVVVCIIHLLFSLM